VTVTGPGSQWTLGGLTVGASGGQGTLTIADSGVVNSAPGATIGLNAGAMGTVTVTGASSQWTLGGLTVGASGGQGTLTIADGGVVDSAPGATIGLSAGAVGTVTLTGASSQWTLGGLTVGASGGQGTLTIESGAVVTGASGIVGSSTGSLGTVVVTDAGSTWINTTTLEVGINGTGSLTVQNGGLVAAGTLQNPETITIGALGNVDAKGGTLIGNIVNDGTFDPLGTATVDGGFTLNSDGTLSLDVAGTGSGQYGVLDVSGVGAFDGTLSLDFIDGFAPLKGDIFVFIDDNTATFDFANTDILGLKPGFLYSENFSDGQFTLTALNNGQSATPEPGALILLGSGLLGLGVLERRRRGRTGARELKQSKTVRGADALS